MRNWLTRIVCSTAVIMAACFSAVATADEQFLVGEQKAKVCMTCHGSNGIATIDAYPNLRGQNMTYLITALRSYQLRDRSAGLAVLMQQQADTLSPQDIKDIAYYYSQLGKQRSSQ